MDCGADGGEEAGEVREGLTETEVAFESLLLPLEAVGRETG